MYTLSGLRPLVSRFSSLSSLRVIRLYSSATSSSYEHLLVSTPKPGVGLSKPAILIRSNTSQETLTDPTWHLTVTLNRPKALNALSSAVFVELNDALRKFDHDKDTGAIVMTGSEKAFAGTN